ncbi:hypothetical protein OsJ_25058 [Oryza sativa Japonica Group]|uniref:HMA domain-containing protein n=1 Tax=Oryza sativa subsp. japonica TaxID=39947 RepID=B9FYC0_ORYSJ|nr:hypothetical protein OsJ_25058 [Oryza sativa Japonica Group]
MADKISTVVLNVDLECDRCYKKIRRVLCRIQDKANIKTISYDEKNNAVMVSGPFDADKVCKKLCCKAGRIIKDMQVKGKENKGGKDAAGDKAKPAEKDGGGGKAEKKDAAGGDKAEKKDGGGKPEKEAAKADKAAAAAAKPEKKVKFDVDDAPPPAAATAKPGKVQPFPAGMTQADLAPLLEKLKIAKQQQQQQQQAGPEPPRGEPIAPPMMMPAAQGRRRAVHLAGARRVPLVLQLQPSSLRPVVILRRRRLRLRRRRVPGARRVLRRGTAARRRPTTTRDGTTATGSRTTTSSNATRTPTPAGAASCDGHFAIAIAMDDGSNQCV